MGPIVSAEQYERVTSYLEIARKEKFIGAPLEAHVRLAVDGDLYPLLEEYAGELPGLFIVSQVALEAGQAGARPQDEGAQEIFEAREGAGFLT